MRLIKRVLSVLLASSMLLTIVACKDTKEPIAVTIWHYYNGEQQKNFDRLVEQFNSTVGLEENIVVDAVSQGSVNDVSARLMDSLDGKAGASALPSAAALYADAAYAIYRRGKAVDLSQYLSGKEMEQYVSYYWDEGRFGDDDAFYLFPIAKSTEVFMLNQTDWASFAADTGADEASFATWEGITQVAQQYHEWTDARTPAVPDDGKAFFGRDAMANYMLVGCKQLGKALFAVSNDEVHFQIDRGALRRLWDNYYVPIVSGWFTAVGRFRADDVKTGDCIALVGSTSGATYFPAEVTRTDGTAYPISAKVYPLPGFAGTEPYAVQQGAGMLLLSSDKAQEAATVRFLKWFTQPENNISFGLHSGYLPVMQEATTPAAIIAALDALPTPVPDVLRQTLNVGTQMTQEYAYYTSPAFGHGAQARAILEHSLADTAGEARAQALELSQSNQEMTLADAIATQLTEEKFNSWADSLEQALAALA